MQLITPISEPAIETEVQCKRDDWLFITYITLIKNCDAGNLSFVRESHDSVVKKNLYLADHPHIFYSHGWPYCCARAQRRVKRFGSPSGESQNFMQHPPPAQ